MVVMSCARCGEPLVDGKRFCPACGRPADEPHDPASTSELPILSRPDVRKRWIIAAVVLVLILAGIGVGTAVVTHQRAVEQQRAAQQRRAAEERRAAEHRIRLEELRKAYQAMLLLESAVADGVSFVDYGAGLRDAAAALANYEATDDRAKQIRAHLAAALDQNRTAYKLMELMVDFGWRAEIGAGWFARYRKRHPQFYLGTATTGRDALKDCWASATVEMNAARAGLAAYEESP